MGKRPDYAGAVQAAASTVTAPEPACPGCAAEQSFWMGHEIRGVYDGVLYWSCMKCGLAWNRWTREGQRDRLYFAGEQFVREHNAERLVGRGPLELLEGCDDER